MVRLPGNGTKTSRNDEPRDLIVLGRISGLYGVKGWVRVFSHTEPRENIVKYSPWLLRRGGTCETREVIAGRRQGKGVVARLADVDDRDAAAALMGAEIAVRREQLGEASPGEYFWSDLEGLEVVTVGGISLGVIDHLFETGANDVMVVRGDRERLIPFAEPGCVREVDFLSRRVVVDWDPEF